MNVTCPHLEPRPASSRHRRDPQRGVGAISNTATGGVDRKRPRKPEASEPVGVVTRHYRYLRDERARLMTKPMPCCTSLTALASAQVSRQLVIVKPTSGVIDTNTRSPVPTRRRGPSLHRGRHGR